MFNIYNIEEIELDKTSDMHLRICHGLNSFCVRCPHSKPHKKTDDCDIPCETKGKCNEIK